MTFNQELEHASFTFDTIELGSLIVCGLLALPHDLVQSIESSPLACLPGANL